jgi:hypothetical protein
MDMVQMETKESCNFSTQTSRVLKVLFDRFDSMSCAAKSMAVDSQLLSVWRRNGKIPLKKVGRVARFLKVCNELLNYEEVGEYQGFNVGWIELLKKNGPFLESEMTYILKGKAPKPYKGK